MPGNTLFYAYVHNVHDENTSRLIVVFDSRYVADEWWRAIYSLPSSKVAPGSFQRRSPQFYTHDTSKANLLDFWTSSTFKDIAPRFKGHMFITLDNDRGGRGISILPEQDVVDSLSGDLFYIRSRHNPDLFWNYGYSSQYLGGEVSVATTPTRYRFRVTAADNKLAKGTVLIGSDKVIIQIADGLYVSVSESKKLMSSNEPHQFLFSDLLGRKFTSVDETVLMYSADGSGDAWELA